MSNKIAFKAQLWSIRQDHEGESKVTFAIPLSDLEKVLKLGEWTQRLLDVEVTLDAAG